jgi:hypothetical protein
VAEYTPLQLTAIGQNALAKAQTGIALQFTKVKFGDGTATDISALTDLVRPVMTVLLTSTSIVNGIVKISCLLSNDSLANGFYVKEIGIFATQNGQEFLYAYTKATNADYIPPASSGPITQQFNFQFAVQAGTNITFQVPNDAVVLQTEKGQANGVATLDANAKVPVTQLPIATPTAPGLISVPDKLKLDSVQSGAEPNQNAFSNVKVGTTTIAADSKTDTLELVAGANIVLTPDAANDKVTIDVTGVAPASHTHPFSDITNKPTTVDGYGITDAVKTSDVVTSPAPNKILKLDANGKLPTSITGNADGNAATASKLQTARTISLTGDATGSTSFDGSSNASIAVTLANSGVTPGTYPKVTVDAKGRVTGGQALSPSDIPNLDWSKITSGKPTTLSGYGIGDGVQNAGGVPSIQAGADASKPSAGVAGRLYVATDTKKIYRDNGTSWDVIGTINWADITGKPTTLAGYGITDGVPIGRKINVGAGLTGGGDLSSDRTISVSFGGNGSATTVARSDHNHDATYVKKAGDTMTGVLSIQRQGDGVELLKFNTERAWSFYQKGTGASANLELKSSMSDKSLLISSANGDPTLEVRVSDTPSNKKVTVYSNLDINGTITTNGNTVETTTGAQAKANQAETNAKNYLDNQKGQPNGVATLGPDGKVPASQLNISMTGLAISITDSGGYYTSGNVEGALQEIGQKQNDLEIFYWMGAI